MSEFMRDHAKRRGPYWRHLSDEELFWICGASFSLGLIVGLVIAFSSIGGSQ